MSTQPVQTSVYTVREATHVSREEWDNWIAASPGGGHIFQSHQWGEFKRIQQGWRPLRLLLEKDGEVAGAAQFLLRPTFPIPGKMMYAPKGPCLPFDDEEAVRAFFEAAAKIARREGAHTIKIEPEVEDERTDAKERMESMGFEKARYDLNFDATVLLNLDVSEEDLLAGMHKTVRYNVRLAGRKGIEVSEPEDFDAAFETFYRWRMDLQQRKEGLHIFRSRQYSYDYMRMLYDSGQGHFFFAYSEGDPIAGGYFVTIGRKLYYMVSASPQHGQKLKPNYALQWEVMRQAKEWDVTGYDMMAAPKRENRHEEDPYYGVYKFKRGFGGEVVDFLGCYNLPARPRLAALWRLLEPVHYRVFFKLKKEVFY